MFEHFKREEVFVKKVLDYLDQVQYKQRLILTQFLDPYHQSIVKSVIGHQDEVQVLENGGFIHSESQRMIIAPYFYEIEKEDFEIVVCKIIYAKNFEKLTHRDILGALMSLGIKRELFGDIVEKDKDFYLAVDRHIYEYLKDKSELELLCEERGNLLQMKNLDKNSKEYQILDSDNKIIDILLDPSTPELILNKEVTDFFDFDNSKELSDVKLVKYKHMGKIPMPIAQ